MRYSKVVVLAVLIAALSPISSRAAVPTCNPDMFFGEPESCPSVYCTVGGQTYATDCSHIPGHLPLRVGFLVACGLGLITGLIAKAKGRSFFGWFVFGFFLFVIALIASIVVQRRAPCPSCGTSIGAYSAHCSECGGRTGFAPRGGYPSWQEDGSRTNW